MTRAAEFFRSKLGPPGARQLERGLEAADRCIAIRRKGEGAVASYLGLPGRSAARATNAARSDQAKIAIPSPAP